MSAIEATETEGSAFRTNDMALVTYLKMCGFSCQRTEWDGGTCYWYFMTGPKLLGAAETFASGEAVVEPREYNKIFGLTKHEFYDSDPSEVNRR
jgi:hypothetical protein